MKAEEHQSEMSSNEVLGELHKLGKLVNESNDATAVKALQSFINLYINNERQSEQYFLALCEYNILPKLFIMYMKHTSALETLETLNLMVANCSKMNQLVFIFSQSTLHQFLFERFSIEKENGETVEYYAQLLKAIIMKISIPGNHSLIKLFCNSRFPHFPLLTVITMLGVQFSQEVLVRVTANQCFLLLIKLLNQTKVGVEYLSEVQTIIYYHQLTSAFFKEGEEEQREMIRFVVDLILQLKKNVVSLSIFMNLLTNGLFFTNIDRPALTLRFISNFYLQMQGHADFPNDLAEETVSVLLSIFTKYYTGLTINYSFYTAQKILADFTVPEKPNLLKFYQKRCKKIQQYLILQMPLFQEQKELQFVWQQWQHFCYKNQQISPLKQFRRKSRNRFTQLFVSDDQLVEEYVKAILTKAGLSCQKINKPLYKLSYSTEYQTALYLVEYVNCKFGSNTEKQKLKYQYFYKDSIWQLKMNQDFLCQIYKICKMRKKQVMKFEQKLQKQMSRQSIESNGSCFSNFLQNIKTYLAKCFVSVLGSHQSHLQIAELCLISSISCRLGLISCLQMDSINSLMHKLRQLQMYITEDIFSEQNFHFVMKYICRGKEKSMLKKIDRIKQCDSPSSPKKKFYKIRTRIQRNFVQYQVIKRLIDFSVKSLSDFVEEYWKLRFFAEKEGLQTPITLFLYKFSNGSTLEVMADKNYQFFARKSNKDNESVNYCISKDDCSFDQQNPTYLSFGDHKFFIDLQTQEKAQNFRQDLSRLRKQKAELIMNGILQYLSFSYQSLAIVCNLKFSRIKMMQTPL